MSSICWAASSSGVGSGGGAGSSEDEAAPELAVGAEEAAGAGPPPQAARDRSSSAASRAGRSFFIGTSFMGGKVDGDLPYSLPQSREKGKPPPEGGGFHAS